MRIDDHLSKQYEYDVLVLLITFSSKDETNNINRLYRQLASGLPDSCSVKIVIWDNKSWGTESSSPVDYHSSPQGNIGFGAAVNSVDKLYSYRRILLLNTDIDLDQTQFNRLVAAVWELKDEVIWSPQLMNQDGTPQTEQGSLFMRTPIQEVVDIFGFPAKRQRRSKALFYLRGAVFSISSELLRSVGGFDEKYFLYGEEADLCFRLDGHCVLVMDPEIKIVHHGSQGHKSKSPAALEHAFRARVLLHERYSSPGGAYLVSAAVGLAKILLAGRKTAGGLAQRVKSVSNR